MTTKPFRGIFPYLVSPVASSTGHVRERALRQVVEHVIAQGVHGLSPLGCTGEFAYLTFEQRCEVVIYTNPGLLGGDVTPEMVIALSAVPNIRYVKDASGTTGRILSMLNRAGGRVQVFSASAHIPVVVFQLGGVGWMAGPACVAPAACMRLYDLAQQGRWEEAVALQRRLWPLNELFQRYALAACWRATQRHSWTPW